MRSREAPMTCHCGRELKRLSGASVTVRVEAGDA
jgi:hypothetical protein